MSYTENNFGEWVPSFRHIGRVLNAGGAVVAECPRLTSLTEMQARARAIAAMPDLLSIAARLAALHEGLANGSSAAEDAACRLAAEASKLLTKATGAKNELRRED